MAVLACVRPSRVSCVGALCSTFLFCCSNANVLLHFQMVDPDLTLQLLHTVQLRNEDSLTSNSGIIPGEPRFDPNLMSLQTLLDLFQRKKTHLICEMCYCSHRVHCPFACSLRRPLEVHGVAAPTKAQQTEGESETEDVCVKTGFQVQGCPESVHQVNFGSRWCGLKSDY
ncbi:synaptobrevin homolog YKT6 isoform X3 [Anarrhichthys ocellatus]|uniref:synaptobrevin homolog YKT6 isoform X3 n=1 Tax=Anarrhichthys ocellatus TaxID=433405 RepID=UPI0012ECE59A|nr:synaptobrevin homolog YKT6 isoform X3 [Anarrhichthys ocellatus]